MINRNEVVALIDELHTASALYYQEMEISPLDDDEFDEKAAFLATQQDAFPDLFTPGSKGALLLEGDPALGTQVAADEDEIVVHAVPMLSLAKAKTEDELKNFARKLRAAGAKDFRLQAKLDGFALSAEYDQGKLVRLSTRGNGTVGEDTSYLFTSDEVTIIGLPTTISILEPLEVRGEMFLTDDQFRTLDEARTSITGAEAFKNPRNGLVGTVKKAKGGLGYPAEVTYGAYSVVEASTGDLVALDTVASLGFLTVDAITQEQVGELPLTGFTNDDELFDAIHKFGEARQTFTIPTDGVVIKPTNEREMHRELGSSSHHPRSQVAFKFPSPTAVSELLSIDLTVGKTGKITPIGRIKTVDLDGSAVSNVSLHNFNLVYTKNIRVGATILVHKANDIIPQIKAVISTPEGAELIPVPTTCPVCEETLSAAREEKGTWPPKTLLCKNMDCPSRDFFALKIAVGKNYLDIDGMSEKLLAHLNDSGRVTTIADLYTLTFEELANSDFGTTKDGGSVRLGEKRAQNILDHIEKSKATPMPRVVASLSIPGLGRSMTKILMKRFKNIDELLAASVEEIAELDKLGAIRAEAIVNGLKHRSTLIQILRDHGVEFAVEEVATDAPLKGLSFAISGEVPAPFANRGKFVEYVEANGGEFHSSPKAHTSFMIGDAEASSSKAKAAIKHGVTFLTPVEFTDRYVSV